MYKLVIADDDKVIQEGFMREIAWNDLGFEVVGIFDDGETLIEFLESVQVDVILTDVKMSHIGGIEVARYVYESKLFCKIVLISAYKEFEFVRQALQYGVVSYIIKPPEEEQIKEVFEKIRCDLDEEARNYEISRLTREHWDSLRPMLAEKFVNNLFAGVLDDKNEAFQRMRVLYPETDVEHCPCALANLEIIEYEQFILDKWKYGEEQLNDAINNFVSFYKGEGYFHLVNKNGAKIRLFVVMNRCMPTKEENFFRCSSQIKLFAKLFKEILDSDVLLEIEKIFEDIYEVIDCQTELITNKSNQENKAYYVQEQKIEILTNVIEGNISYTQKSLRSCLECLTDADRHIVMDFVQWFFSALKNMLVDNNSAEERRIKSFLNFEIVRNMEDVDEVKRYCDKVLDFMKSIENFKGYFDESNLLSQIKKYVELHIYEDICMDNLADKLFISTRHMRRIFKNMTGETFLQYVTARKMEKAAQLLQDPQYKVYQIGEKLGYKTPRYFSKVFNNYYSCYPNQYRQKVLGIEGGEEDKAKNA